MSFICILQREHRHIPVFALFKAWMCCRPLVGIAVSNPARNMDICQVEVYATGRSFNQGSPTGYVCVGVSLSMMRCNNNTLYLKLLGRKRSD